MIVVIEILMFILGAGILAWGCYVGGKKIAVRYTLAKATSPAQTRNKNKEETFTKDLLEDIHMNTDQWFLTEDVMNGILLANDHKNIGIVYGPDRVSATILLNLNKLVEFTQDHEDTVKVRLVGDHIKKFLTTAEELIDRRGKELAFFQSELEKRL